MLELDSCRYFSSTILISICFYFIVLEIIFKSELGETSKMAKKSTEYNVWKLMRNNYFLVDL